MKTFPETGVGMVYLPGLQQLIEPHLGLMHVLEIEPQTLWYCNDLDGDSIRLNREQNELLQSYPLPKLFHSVGLPVGSILLPTDTQMQALQEHVSILSPLGISEHLSFNNFLHHGKRANTNFLLPPLQTEEGVRTSVAAISHFRSAINLPFAFETGTNYLRTKETELTDGDFVDQIARLADCSILLDLHNLLANQRNGRQSIDDFISSVDPERISEIHIAGGMLYKNFYLDAHSGASEDELLTILEKVVIKLPALKALVFEMLPDYADKMPGNQLRRQLEVMNRIWDKRGSKEHLRSSHAQPTTAVPVKSSLTVEEWQQTLGALSIGLKEKETELESGILADPGLEIINDLVFHFRASMVVSTLTLTTRLLQVNLGEEAFKSLLSKFLAESLPAEYPFVVAEYFATFLEKLDLHLPYLSPLVEFELAALKTMIDGEPRSVFFNYNPFPLFRSLSRFALPELQDQPMEFVLDIKPDELMDRQEASNFSSVYHN